MAPFSADNLLIAVTGVGYFIAFASTIWAATRETSIPVDGGRKRLTRAGQLSIGLAFLSAMLSTTALALKLNIDAGSKKATKDREVLEARLSEMQRQSDRQFQASLQQRARQYQNFLFELGQADARRNKQDIVQNQGLLAEVASSTEASRFSDARIAQIALQQQAILKSQPLRSLTVQIAVRGLPPGDFAALEAQYRAILNHSEVDDEFGRASDEIRHEIEQANVFRSVLMPALRLGAGLQKEGPAVVLIDLDGFGGLYVPVGFHGGEGSKGLFLSENDLAGLANWDVYKDFHAPPCAMPVGWIDERSRTIGASITLSGSCLGSALNGADKGNPTAFIAREPRLILFVAGPDGLPVGPEDVTRYAIPNAASCFGQGGRRKPTSVFLQLIPNRMEQLGARMALMEVERSSLATSPDYYEGTQRNYGECVAYVGRRT